MDPISEQDIMAARLRAAEGTVPWDRRTVLQQAIARVKERQRLRRRRRWIIASAASFVALLVLLLWLFWMAR